MITVKNPSDLKDKKISLAIGNFDGVHLGHKRLIQKMKDQSQEGRRAVMTFTPHPLRVLMNKKKFLINTYEEKKKLLEGENIDFLLEIKFDKHFSQLSPRVFFQNFLYPISGLKQILVGHDFTFGIKKSGTLQHLQDSFKNSSVSIETFNDFEIDQERVSSTKVRHYIRKGNIEYTNKLLERQYFLTGTVFRNLGRGNRIGFPTINMKCDDDLLVPPCGVYATNIQMGNTILSSVTNIGIRPTFNDGKGLSIETHILNFNRNITIKNVRIFFISRLRDEKKFQSSDQLAGQIKRDIQKRMSL